MTEDLAPIDRWTLYAWRGMNVAGWGAFAYAVAAVIHRAADVFSTRFYANLSLNVRPDFYSTLGFVVPKMWFRFGVSLLVGLAIGGIVGVKVWRWRPGVAALVATAYVLIVIMTLEFSFPSPGALEPSSSGISVTATAHGVSSTGAAGWIYDAIAALTIPIAALWARHIGKRRI